MSNLSSNVAFATNVKSIGDVANLKKNVQYEYTS